MICIHSVCIYCLKDTSVQGHACHPHVSVSVVVLWSPLWGRGYNSLVIAGGGGMESGSSAWSLHSLPWSVSFTPHHLFGRWTSGSSFYRREAGAQSQEVTEVISEASLVWFPLPLPGETSDSVLKRWAMSHEQCQVKRKEKNVLCAFLLAFVK